jgi:hypothetical protein
VPTIIEAATTIFAGHSVKNISRSDAENLAECSREVLRLIEEAKTEGRRRLLGAYPITLTRSLQACRGWLKQSTGGQRRAGLLASSRASRLLAEGLGASLTVEDKSRICRWYLKPIGDYRSSDSLEVTANEYTCQGLELDFAGRQLGEVVRWH